MVFLVLGAAYILGSIPGAVLVGRLWGVRITEEGSTNPGTANVLRLLGKGPALFCLLIDVGKGFLAVFLGELAGLGIGAAGAVIAGHNWSIFLRGRGGKGIATMVGALLFLSPIIVPLIAGIFVIINFITSYIAVSSVLAGLFLPLLLHWQLEVGGLWLGLVIAVMLILKHWKNLRVTLQGEEERKNILRGLISKGGEGNERKDKR